MAHPKVKKGTIIKLSQEWILGYEIGRGGFAPVFAASAGDHQAVVKPVPNAPGLIASFYIPAVEGKTGIVDRGGLRRP